jgi:predicted SAM-dependent methyltransferase
MAVQVHPDHYFNEVYEGKGRFISYWHQIDEIISLNPRKILEVGVGSGFVSGYLKERNINVITLDIDKRLNPVIIGNVLNLPFKENSFDIIVCCEVLEHLDYENFYSSILEISRVSRAYIILSMPDVSRVSRFSIQVPVIGDLKLLIPIPRFRKLKHKFDGEHYWEIGKKGYPIKKIINDIQRTGMYVEKTYRIFEYPYHRFFLLKKN